MKRSAWALKCPSSNAGTVEFNQEGGGGLQETRSQGKGREAGQEQVVDVPSDAVLPPAQTHPHSYHLFQWHLGAPVTAQAPERCADTEAEEDPCYRHRGV